MPTDAGPSGRRTPGFDFVRFITLCRRLVFLAGVCRVLSCDIALLIPADPEASGALDQSFVGGLPGCESGWLCLVALSAPAGFAWISFSDDRGSPSVGSSTYYEHQHRVDRVSVGSSRGQLTDLVARDGGMEAAALEKAATFARGFGDWNDDMTKLYAARRAIAAMIAQKGGAQ